MWKKVLLVLVLIIGIGAYRYSTIPDLVKLEIISHFSARRYYSWTSITMEGPPVDTATITHVKIYKGFFSIDQHLDLRETKKLLKFLNSPGKESTQADRTNAESSIVINYYNDDLLLGFTYIHDGYMSTYFPTGSTTMQNRNLTSDEIEAIRQL